MFQNSDFRYFCEQLNICHSSYKLKRVGTDLQNRVCRILLQVLDGIRIGSEV